MISVLSSEYSYESRYHFEFIGKSTDTKPIGNYNYRIIENGSIFVEMDTGTIYFFDEELQTWMKYRGDM